MYRVLSDEELYEYLRHLPRIGNTLAKNLAERLGQDSLHVVKVNETSEGSSK